jgi:hypothetical protein
VWTSVNGHTVTRQDILNAMRDFDRKYGDTDGYQDWLAHKTHGCLVWNDGQPYPTDLVLALAIGISKSELGGNEQINRAFVDLGFSVNTIERTKSSLGLLSSIVSKLKRFFPGRRSESGYENEEPVNSGLLQRETPQVGVHAHITCEYRQPGKPESLAIETNLEIDIKATEPEYQQYGYAIEEKYAEADAIISPSIEPSDDDPFPRGVDMSPNSTEPNGRLDGHLPNSPLRQPSDTASMHAKNWSQVPVTVLIHRLATRGGGGAQTVRIIGTKRCRTVADVMKISDEQWLRCNGFSPNALAILHEELTALLATPVSSYFIEHEYQACERTVGERPKHVPRLTPLSPPHSSDGLAPEIVGNNANGTTQNDKPNRISADPSSENHGAASVPPKDWSRMPISALTRRLVARKGGIRIVRALDRAHCYTIADVLAKSDEQWLQRNGFGKMTLEVLHEELAALGAIPGSNDMVEPQNQEQRYVLNEQRLEAPLLLSPPEFTARCCTFSAI